MSAPKADAAATLAGVIAAARRRVEQADLDDPALEARLIVEHFTGTERADTLRAPERPVAPDVAAAIDRAIERRLAGEPVHRIFGYRDFYGVRLALSPETLEPRPDTETLVDAILPFLRQVVKREGRCRILDLGTGTGAIGLALASQIPQSLVTATDISTEALATAVGNAAAAGVSSRFKALDSDWFSAIGGKFHAIVSNPPYIPSEEIDGLQAEVRLHDPRKALDGGPDGLDAYRQIAEGAATHLEHDGQVAVEIGHTQRQEVGRLFAQAGYQLVSMHRDLAGSDRVMVFSR
jgi:release factor glutamine methyltransferase